MNSTERVLQLEEEVKDLKNQLAMRSNKVKELEYVLEHQKPKGNEVENKTNRVIKMFLQHDPEGFIKPLDDLITSFMCFDSAADCSKERNEKVYCVNSLKHHINRILALSSDEE